MARARNLKSLTIEAFKADPVRDALLRKTFADEGVKAPEDGKGPITFTISTEAVDRDNDTIRVAGWDVSRYNGVVLFAHQSYMPPVGKSVVKLAQSKLVGEVEFVPRDLYDFGGMIGDMVRAGFMNSSSVGFRPLKWEMNEERGAFAIDFKEQELLEWSVVPVPSNWEATTQRAKAAGIDVAPMKAWAEQVLGEEKGVGRWVARTDLEAVLKLLGPTALVQVPLDLTGSGGGGGGGGGKIAGTVTVGSGFDGSGGTGFIGGGTKGEGAADPVGPNEVTVDDVHAALKGYTELAQKFAALHGDMERTRSEMDVTHKAMADLTAKALAALAVMAPGEEASVGGIVGKGTHRFSGVQERRIRKARRELSNALAAHEDAFSDDDEVEPDEDDAIKASKADDATSVQTVICSKDKFDSAEAAKKWVTDHDFRADKVDETDSSYRFRQFPPADCKDASERTIELTAGVKAVVCHKKKSVDCGCPEPVNPAAEQPIDFAKIGDLVDAGAARIAKKLEDSRRSLTGKLN